MSWSALSLRVDHGVESLIPVGGDDLARLRRFHETFGSDEVIVMALRSSEDLFTAEHLTFIEDLTRGAARLPHVARVLSPTSARDLDGDELGPFPVVPYEKVLAGEMTPAELGQVLASHPLFSGLLVSRDSRTAALLIELDPTEGDPQLREAVSRVRELASRADSRGLSAYVAGLPVERVDVVAYVERDQKIFAPIILLMLAAVMAILYRHAVGVIVPLSVVAASLIWTLGLYGLAGRSLNPVTSLITPVVLVVSVASAVHLINHHLVARGEGLPRPAALQRAYLLSRGPCFAAALTTAIGFISLTLVPIPAIRDFGLFTAAGVLFSYALTMALSPLLLGWLPDFPPRVTGAFLPGSVEMTLQAIAAWVCRRSLLAGLAAAAVLALSVVGLTRIRIETDLIRSLRPGTPLRQATAFIDSHLTGVNALEITITGVESTDPEGMGRVADFERDLRRLPGIRKVTGLADLFARVNRAIHGGQEAFETLPQGRDAREDLRDIQDLMREESPAEMARFLSADGKVLRLSARVTAIDTATSQALFRRIREAAAHAGIGKMEMTGHFAILSDMSTSLVYNQARGLMPALVLIVAAMVVEVRSLRLGLICAIPNGAAVIMVYGLMGWMGIALSVPTAMIASIGLGMTDDNTIHLMARFREEFRAKSSYVAALGTMLQRSGKAMVFSTVMLALGFWVGIFSSFLPSVHFAVLTGAALLLGLAAEAVLLPLALILFKPLGRSLEAARTAGRASPALLLLLVTIAATNSVPAWPEARAAAASSTARAGARVILKDQYGKTDGPGLHRGKMVLLLYGKPAGLRRMKAWEVNLPAPERETLRIVRGLDARSVRGKKSEAEVSRRLRQSVPPEVSILIDWDGEVAKAYAIPDAEVTATIIDPEGTSCGTMVGPAEPELLHRAIDLIIRVKYKGSCP